MQTINNDTDTDSRRQACSHSDLSGKNFDIICYSHLVVQLIIQEPTNPQKGHLWKASCQIAMWAELHYTQSENNPSMTVIHVTTNTCYTDLDK